MIYFLHLVIAVLIFQVTQAQNYFVSPTKLNYADAVKYCKDKQMQLVTIQNAEANAAVYSLVVKNNLGQYWINGNNIAKQDTWVDSNGKALSYTNWKPGEPNNWNNIQHCAHGGWYPNGFWDDFDCNTQNSFICEDVKVMATCLNISPTKLNYADAVKYCKDKQMQLVTIRNAEANAAVYSLVVKNNLGQYWINGNNIAKQDTWVDSNGKALSYTNWKPGEPNNWNNIQHCAHGGWYPNGFWDDFDCNTQNSFMCEGVKELKDVIHIATTKMSFDAAVNYCRGKQMELIKIDNGDANIYVYNLAVKNNLGAYWINGNDKTKEGTWVDTNGKELIYKNWNPGEPNNAGGVQHCAQGSYYPNGLWDDYDCNASLSVLCVPSNDSCKF